MPHYANGKEAKVHDVIVTVPQHPQTPRVLGILVSIQPGSESCNGQVMPLARKWQNSEWMPVIGLYQDCITLKESLPIELLPVGTAASSA